MEDNNSLETLEWSVEEALLASEIGQLEEACHHLGLRVDSVSKLKLIRAIRSSLDSEEDEGAKANLLVSLLSKLPSSRTSDHIDTRLNYPLAEQQLEEMAAMPRARMSGSVPVDPAPRTSGPPGPDPGRRPSTGRCAHFGDDVLPTTVLKREFKITGSINTQRRGDKPSLSYISLVHQIEQGERQHYSDEEIVAGVIRAMQPGLRLRTVLETLPSLRLPRLRRMLRCHYHERSATELFQELANSVQHGDEGADEFLIRIYETRQKLFFLGKETGKESLSFDPKLVQTMFIKSIETGLADESIRNKIRPLLTTPREMDSEEQFEEVNDNILVEVSSAAITELERSTKLLSVTSSCKKPRVAFTGVNDTIGHAVSENNRGKKEESGTILSLLQSVQTQLGSLTLDVNQLKSVQSPTGTTWGQRTYEAPKCNQCITDQVSRCNHCFRCGSADHFARGCKQPRNDKKEENSSRHR